MNWILTTGLCLAIVEIGVRLPFLAVAARLKGTAGRAVGLMRTTAVSDRWKEKALLAYAGSIFAGSAKLAGLLVCLALPAALLSYLFDRVSGDFGDFIVRWPAIAFSVLLAVVYLKLRKRLPLARL